MGTPRSRWWDLRRTFAARLVAAMLLVSVPLMGILAWLLTTASSDELTSVAEIRGENTARAVTTHLEGWLEERQEHLQVIAVQAARLLDDPDLSTLLVGVNAFYDDYERVDITDLSGTILASTQPGSGLAASRPAWFRTARSGLTALTSLEQRGDRIEWILAVPVLGSDGRPVGVVAADLNAAELATLLNPELDEAMRVIVSDAERNLIYDTAMGAVESPSELLAAGALGSQVDNAVTRKPLTTAEPGPATFADPEGRTALGGYDILDDCVLGGRPRCTDWVITAAETEASVVAPIADQRNRALVIVLLAILAAVAVSSWLAIRTTQPIRRLTAAAQRAADGDLSVRVEPEGASELRTLGASVNAMLTTSQQLVEQVMRAGVAVNSSAALLSASSDELAATTTQQSAAVTQATSTTEELARASAAIADTVDEVADQTAETKDNLQQAEVDITLSSERTLELARRVDDIDALLDLINEIADQTNLLALNAAIEAARAGENGLGFAVVADEVRRLAERSKTSAAEITTIIQAVQGETNATVMAMEKGAKQMQRGLLLLGAVTDANAQVRMTTQQQRSATSQVVETMEQLTDASRQVSATADQIAAAAGNLADLAGNLEKSVETATTVQTAASNGHH